MEQTSEEESILISRVVMEDNMFDIANNTNHRNIPLIHIESSNSYERKWKSSHLKKYREFYTVLAVALQIVFGVLSNSLTLVADATRIFADHLEQFEIDRAAAQGKRLMNIFTIGITTLVLFLLFIAFLLAASARAATMDFDINRAYLIIGCGLAMTSNTFQTLWHLKFGKNKRNDHSFTLNSSFKKSQLIHCYGYHFVAYFVLVSTFLIVANKSYIIADPVTTYVASLLLLANISSIGVRLYNEYILLEHPYDEYESL